MVSRAQLVQGSTKSIQKGAESDGHEKLISLLAGVFLLLSLAGAEGQRNFNRRPPDRYRPHDRQGTSTIIRKGAVQRKVVSS